MGLEEMKKGKRKKRKEGKRKNNQTFSLKNNLLCVGAHHMHLQHGTCALTTLLCMGAHHMHLQHGTCALTTLLCVGAHHMHLQHGTCALTTLLCMGAHHMHLQHGTCALTKDMVNLERCSKCLAMSVASTRSMMELLKLRYVVLCVCVCMHACVVTLRNTMHTRNLCFIYIAHAYIAHAYIAHAYIAHAYTNNLPADLPADLISYTGGDQEHVGCYLMPKSELDSWP